MDNLAAPDSERLNLGYTGLPTFAKVPYQPDLSGLDADVAIVGAPYDLSSGYRAGARFGPRGIRSGSAIYSLHGSSYYDLELDQVMLDGVELVDVGDIDMVYARPDLCLRNIESVVGQLLDAGTLPVILGGDHAVPIPTLRAYAERGPICVVQIDAHLDFLDERGGVREGHGNVIRRISEMDHVDGIAQIGIRGPGQSTPEAFRLARDQGNVIIGPREFRRIGIDAVLARIPDRSSYYVTIDCDGFDAALMPGTGSPSPGGFDYTEVADLLRGVARKGEVVGFDFVEVAPEYDPTGVTCQTASRVILDFLGAIFLARAERAANVGGGR